MKKPKKRTMKHPIALVLSLIAMAAIAHGAEKATQHSVLKSSISSAAEISDDLRQIKFNLKLPPRISSICEDLGACEELTYYDPTDTIHIITPGAKGLKDEQTSTENSAFSSQQFEVQSFLNVACPFSKPRAALTNVGLFPILRTPTDCYINAFAAKGFLNPEAIKQANIATLDSAYSDLVAGKQSPAQFSSLALNLPKAFPHLPELLSRARASQNATAIQTIQDVTAKALLLTLDAMVPVSNSSNATYPFFDNLVPDHSLLSVNDLYQKLSKIKQWPATTDLSPELRKSLGGIYNDKTSSSDSARWKVKGFYEQSSNEVMIDLANDFYENTFVYFHELWHVAWAHSPEGQKQTSAIVELLKDPTNDSANLKNSILKALSTNEFLAMDQQIRLFHAMGYQAQDWDDSLIPSSLAWHNSYFGQEAYQLLEIRSKDRGDDYFENEDRNGNVSWGVVEDAYERIRRAVTNSQYKSQKNKIKAELDAKYWQQQIETHSKLFESAYFGENLGLSKEIQPITPDELIQTVVSPEVPILSCGTCQRIWTRDARI